MHQNNNKANNITTQNNNNNKKNNIPHPRRHGSTTQACAACKYQRRKCASDCILAPYFPHDRQRQFLNAHRLFGVSNIVKIVRHLEPPAKDLAMRTIIYQSDARAADPIGGCHRIIRDLEQQISLAQAELEIVLHHLALCRAAVGQQELVPPPPAAGDSSGEVVVDDVNPFPHHDHQNVRRLSMEECSNDLMKPILDHLGCDDDVRDEEFIFDSHGNIVPSKNALLDKAIFDQDDECISYVQDHHDLKAAATFFSLTNCDI